MLGAAGVVVPGLLSKVGILSVPDWWLAGEVAIKDSGIPLGALISVQLFAMGWAEASRYQVSPARHTSGLRNPATDPLCRFV